MIVDDEPGLLDLYEAWLADLDVTVVRAACGAEALATYDDGIDAVVVDRHMPRVSGEEVLADLRDRHPHLPIAFVSAAPPDAEILDFDVDAYLTKPVARETYVCLVQSLLRRATVCETVARYLAARSKQAALLEAKSQSVLRTDPTYAAFEERLTNLASSVAVDSLDDPFLRHVRADSGGCVLPSSHVT
jgi:CheY-like chemotaxis protein